ncbi:MAG TPA: long-chain fatty acid--CoA ligase [Candidatus Dormibacteraeota bacterium]|nr:long-chain fatty acid--CoA ligase [Candidatus Dormibacteraeota bacterium]
MDVRTIPDLLRHSVETHRKPDAFLVKRQDRWEPVSISELAERVRAVARDLAARGVKHGDRVAILSENRIEWAIADQAILSIGGVVVPIYATLPADHIAPMLADSGAIGAFVSSVAQEEKLRSVIREAPALSWILCFDDGMPAGATVPQPDGVAAPTKTPGPEDLATLIYTSGTTGTPKGVMLTHRNLVSNAVNSLTAFDVNSKDVHLSFLPLNHIFERTAGYNVMIYAGATIAYAESIEKAALNLQEVRPTILLAVPRFYEKLIDRAMEVAKAAGFPRAPMALWGRRIAERWAALKLEGRSVSPLLALQHAIADKLVYSVLRRRLGGRIRSCFSGGAALARETALFFHGVGMPIMEGYGLTETSPVIAVNTPKHYKLGTVGRPIQGVEVRIAGDGEILVRGPSVMKGYWNRPEETAAALQDGWFHTGDIGELDADGFLRITDRKKDIIVTSGGKKIAPQPIQNALKKSPRILEAVVLGDGHKYAVALIVPANGATHEAIAADVDVVNKGLASYETIKHFELIPNDLSVENGSLSQKMELKRKVVSDRYRDLIEKMYHAEK